MSHYVVKTLGCKANLYDSQLIEAELQRRGWLPALDGATPELCIVNSCTVTDEADRQSRRLASRLGRDNPRARVVVTGCAAEVDPERLARSKGIHYVVGNQDKPRLVQLILEKIGDELAGESSDLNSATSASTSQPGQLLGAVSSYGELVSRHPIDREWPVPASSFATDGAELTSGESAKTRAFLKIQEGCNSFCTYCIIPYGRGPGRSLEPDAVVRQAWECVQAGAREIIITGTNIGDYGADLGQDPAQALPELFRRVLNDTRLERLRVGSLDPVEITPELTGLIEQDPRFCPHFHVSLQAAHSRILKLMKRKYSVEHMRECLERIARVRTALPGGAFVGMDVITGFPGETDEEFEAGFAELERLPWTRLHVFPYSEREGTPATRLPGKVAPAVRAERARRLGELSTTRMQAHAESVVGQRLEQVLLERPYSREPVEAAEWARKLGVDAQRVRWLAGYTPNYLKVIVAAPDDASAARMRNQLVSVDAVAAVTDPAQGEVALLARLSR